MRRAVKVRLYPTLEREALFARTAGAARFVYNTGLGLRIDAYKNDGLSIPTSALDKMLPLWKEEFPWLSEVPSEALQQSLRNLDTAYKNFFSACKGDGKARFPRFKTRNSKASFRLVGGAFKVRDGQLFVAKSKKVAVPHKDAGYALPENATSVTISRDAAKNIVAAGLAVLSSNTQEACGGEVSPVPDSSVAGVPDEAGKSPKQHPVLSAA